ncbi:hypothetical protein N3K66_008140 [Trichothecium roseum]|uniref:Uncharacterized protein n=1 Tax=Trichothecium roseum TaxID=47278 RepID=A0ACC0USQ0_9HYPO|nr:hypothetical protein N3K66_008140 [Trichothecium roseum]
MLKSIVAALLGATAAVAQCTGPAVNSATIDLVSSFEGWRPDIYLDPAGLPTVGYGHLCSNSRCSDVPYPIPLSVANGRKLLASDLAVAQNCITLMTNSRVTLNANQYGALVSWSFNVGCGAAKSSSLISRLNAGENPNTVAEQELPKWKFGGGVELPGLVRRRAAEVTLHKTATNTPALPACS